MHVCDQWYQACATSLMCAIDNSGLGAEEQMDFCLEGERHAGIPLGEVEGLRDNPEKFCQTMGFKVFDPPICYDGVPLAQHLTL